MGRVENWINKFYIARKIAKSLRIKNGGFQNIVYSFKLFIRDRSYFKYLQQIRHRLIIMINVGLHVHSLEIPTDHVKHDHKHSIFKFEFTFMYNVQIDWGGTILAY